MKKVLLFFALFFCFYNQIQAQKVKFGIGPVASLVLGGDQTKYHLFGVGADFNAKYQLTEKFETFSNVGMHVIFGRTVLNPGLPQFNLPPSSYKTDPINNIRFLIGARYLSGDFFGGLGVGFSSQNNYSTNFSLSPQIGYRINKFDMILDYTSNQIGNSNQVYINYLGLKTVYYF